MKKNIIICLLLSCSFSAFTQRVLNDNEEFFSDIILKKCINRDTNIFFYEKIEIVDENSNIYLEMGLDSSLQAIKFLKYNFNSDRSLYEEKKFSKCITNSSSTTIVNYQTPYHIDGVNYFINNDKIISKIEYMYDGLNLKSLVYFFTNGDAEKVCFFYDSFKLISFNIYIDNRLWNSFNVIYSK